MNKLTYIQENFKNVGCSSDWCNDAYRIKGNNEKAIILFSEDEFDYYTIIDFCYDKNGEHVEDDIFTGDIVDCFNILIDMGCIVL